MRTLIVPCAGDRKVMGLPLVLLRHPKDGRHLFHKAVEGVFPGSYDRLVFVFHRELEEEYHISELAVAESREREPGLRADVLLLDERTSGSAETVYLALQRCGISGEIAIKDSHSYILLDEACQGNFVACLDLMHSPFAVQDLRTKSFILSNGQGQILDIVEKRLRSDVISAGLYGFKRASDFLEAYERLCDGNYPIQKLFVSHVISYLIGYKEMIFHTKEVAGFEEWGSSAVWPALKRKYANYYIDMEALFGKDINFGNGKDGILQDMAEKSRAGAVFIAQMACRLDGRDIRAELLGRGINCIAEIYGANQSMENIYIASRLDLEAHGA